MPNTLALPEPLKLIRIDRDPKCAQAIAIATEMNREIAARRIGTLAELVRQMLPTAAILSYEFPDGDQGSSVVNAIFDAAGELLAVFDEVQKEHPDVDAVDEATDGAFTMLINHADDWDQEYLPTVCASSPNPEEYLLDLDLALAAVARLDTELAIKRTAPQYQD
jgi:hypothetical protein